MNPRCYDDILDMPHHVSSSHPHMSLLDRAAQFAPFKALTGYEDDVDETARLTDSRIVLDEALIEQLDARLQIIEEDIDKRPEVSITFFIPDSRKSGGSYETINCKVKKLDPIHRSLILCDGRNIAIDDIVDISGALFSSLE
ncbi:MAG: hypothetical protein J5449_07030 [Oscillospiraceae bacterium]|nr:hypothetical protein [Oscillospiraceae bacterium]